MVREIIGLDCACNPASVGLARGYFDGSKLIVGEVMVGSRSKDPVSIISGWLNESAEPGLVAVDAPLGWPVPLGAALPNHRAGAPLDATAHSLFRRSTDVHVKNVVGQQPLDVGADRIARTAHAALGIIDGVRKQTGNELPLAWDADYAESSVIEVYPAATLRVHGFDPRGYKGKAGESVRRAYLERLAIQLGIETAHRVLIDSADACDAVICLLAAADFIQGTCLQPQETGLAAREGWIWVRTPGT